MDDNDPALKLVYESLNLAVMDDNDPAFCKIQSSFEV